MVAASPGTRPALSSLTGRCFVNPLFDYLLIGGGLSLITISSLLGISYLVGTDIGNSPIEDSMIPLLILLSNSAHFAASTVRLYTKPGSRKSMPFLTMGLPIVAIAMVTLSMVFAGSVGKYIQAVYVSWSPFHYAAQAYGLAVMYSFRSGCLLKPLDKKLLWWVAMLPFFGSVMREFDIYQLSRFAPEFGTFLFPLGDALSYLGLLAPFLLYFKISSSSEVPMPLISLLAVFTNGIWWSVYSFYDAFIYATVFHGIQYLAIVIIFHVKDQKSRPENRHGTLYHVLAFYGTCLVLGYCLFNCWPYAYMMAGFGKEESILLVVAAINIHHFIVDAFIWRLKKSDSNRRIVDQEAPATASA